MRLGLRQVERATARPHGGPGQHDGAQVLPTMPASMAVGNQDRHAAARQLEVSSSDSGQDDNEAAAKADMVRVEMNCISSMVHVSMPGQNCLLKRAFW